MTKLIFPVECDRYIPKKPYAVTYDDKYEDFAYSHLDYLRTEKPELLNALLVINELGNYLNLLGRLEVALRDFYYERLDEIDYGDDEYAEGMREMAKEDVETEIFGYFLYDERE